MAGILSFSSCAEDFLKQKNSYQLSPDNYYESDDAVASATYPLYNYVWYDFNDKFYYGMGDGRANNITAQYSNYIYPYTNFTENSLSQGLSEAWGSLYSVVSQSNNTINNLLTKCTSSVSETAKIQGIAEARFIVVWLTGTSAHSGDAVSSIPTPPTWSTTTSCLHSLVRMSSSLPSETWNMLPRIFQHLRDKLVASTNTPHTVC